MRRGRSGARSAAAAERTLHGATGAESPAVDWFSCAAPRRATHACCAEGAASARARCDVRREVKHVLARRGSVRRGTANRVTIETNDVLLNCVSVCLKTEHTWLTSRASEGPSHGTRFARRARGIDRASRRSRAITADEPGAPQLHADSEIYTVGALFRYPGRAIRWGGPLPWTASYGPDRAQRRTGGPVDSVAPHIYSSL